MSEDSSSDGGRQEAVPEVLQFKVTVISLPLNFCVLLNPIMIHALELPDSGAALLRGPQGAIVVVKALPDPECAQTDIRVPVSVQLSLRAAVGDSIPMMAFNDDDQCTALQVRPLFEGRKDEFSSDVSDYFESDSRPVSPGSFFFIGSKCFQILNCLPRERCFADSKTKIYFREAPDDVEEEATLPWHFSDLILPNAIKETVRNGVWLPMNHRELFETLNMPTSSGVLVVGEEGNGKTSFLSAVSNVLNVPSLFVDTRRMVKGNVEEKLRRVFGFAEEREKCVIFLDDIQFLAKKFTSAKFASERRRLALFFSLLDKAMKNPGLTIIASVVSIAQIDESLIRPGRFSFVIDLDKPNASQRADIIRMNTRGLMLDGDDLNALAIRFTNGMKRSEIVEMCQTAVKRMINPESSGVTFPTDSLVAFSKNTKLRIEQFTAGLKIPQEQEQELIEQPETNPKPARQHRSKNAPISKADLKIFQDDQEDTPKFDTKNPFANRDSAAQKSFPRRKRDNSNNFDLSGVAPEPAQKRGSDDDDVPVFKPKRHRK